VKSLFALTWIKIYARVSGQERGTKVSIFDAWCESRNQRLNARVSVAQTHRPSQKKEERAGHGGGNRDARKTRLSVVRVLHANGGPKPI